MRAAARRARGRAALWGARLDGSGWAVGVVHAARARAGGGDGTVARHASLETIRGPRWCAGPHGRVETVRVVHASRARTWGRFARCGIACTQGCAGPHARSPGAAQLQRGVSGAASPQGGQLVTGTRGWGALRHAGVVGRAALVGGAVACGARKAAAAPWCKSTCFAQGSGAGERAAAVAGGAAEQGDGGMRQRSAQLRWAASARAPGLGFVRRRGTARQAVVGAPPQSLCWRPAAGKTRRGAAWAREGAAKPGKQTCGGWLCALLMTRQGGTGSAPPRQSRRRRWRAQTPAVRAGCRRGWGDVRVYTGHAPAGAAPWRRAGVAWGACDRRNVGARCRTLRQPQLTVSMYPDSGRPILAPPPGALGCPTSTLRPAGRSPWAPPAGAAAALHRCASRRPSALPRQAAREACALCTASSCERCGWGGGEWGEGEWAALGGVRVGLSGTSVDACAAGMQVGSSCATAVMRGAGCERTLLVPMSRPAALFAHLAVG